MATSSITHNFVLADRESAERFVRVIEEAESYKEQHKEPNIPYGRLLTDEREISELMSKIKW